MINTDRLRSSCGLMKIIVCAGLIASLLRPPDGLAFVASVTVRIGARRTYPCRRRVAFHIGMRSLIETGWGLCTLVRRPAWRCP